MDVEKLKQLLEEKKFSLYKLSIKSGIGYATLHDIISGKNKNPRVGTVAKIAGVFGKKVDDLI